MPTKVVGSILLFFGFGYGLMSFGYLLIGLSFLFWSDCVRAARMALGSSKDWN